MRFKLSEAIPKKPAKRKIINAQSFLVLDFSVKNIKYPEARINIIGIILKI